MAETSPAALPPPTLWRALADLVRLARLFRSEGPALRRAGALSVVSGLLALSAPALTAALFDRVYPSGNVSLLGLIILGIVAATAGEGAVRNLSRYSAFAARTRMRDTARLALFNHVLHLPARVLERRRSGALATRFADVREVLDAGADAALTAMNGGLYLVVVPPILFLIEPRLALVALVAVPLTAGLTAGLGAAANRRWATTYAAYDEWAAFRTEALREARTWQAMGCQTALYRRARHHVAEAHAGTVRATGLWYICHGANAAVRALHLGALAYLGWRLVLSETLTLGGYVAFQSYAALLLAPLKSIVEAGGKLQRAAVSLGRVFDLADERPEADPAATLARAEHDLSTSDAQTCPRSEGASRAERRSLTGRLRLRGVTFRYRPEAPRLGVPDLDLAPGEAVALVGPSGGGKTTVLRLLAGLERPDAGAVEAETGQGFEWSPIEDVAGWPDRLAVCWQEPGLLSSSVRDNLVLAAEDVAGRPIGDTAVRAVLAACALGGLALDAPLTEGAAALSAGERQRLALARLLLRVRAASNAGRPVRLVLLDEAAANLDAETARAVLSTVLSELRSLPSPPAIVLVSHRSDHAALADRWVRLGEDGSRDARPLTEHGTVSGHDSGGTVPALV